MAFLPIFLLFLVASTMAGEIPDVGDISLDIPATNDVVPIIATAKETSGYEPEFPVHSDLSTGTGGYQCPTLRYRNKCYFLGLSQENWHRARDYCRRIGQTLARVESSDEATFLASYLDEQALRYDGNHYYWIVLNDERAEGIWTNSDGAPAFTDFWAPREPNGNWHQNCGLLVIGQDRIGRLVDDPCRKWHRYICERRTETVCRRAGYKNKCYWFSVQPSTWFNAREYCAKMGQRLARVTSTDESNFLARIMPSPTWIDLRHDGQGVGWTYADGTGNAEIRGHFGGAMGTRLGGRRCAELGRYNRIEGRAIGQDCNRPRNFVCESEPLPPGSEMINFANGPGGMGGYDGGT